MDTSNHHALRQWPRRSLGPYRPISVPYHECRFFSEQRLGLAACGAALGIAGSIALRLLLKEWWLNPDGKACTDFIWIWLSSKFALLGTLASAYDYSVFSAARGIVTASSCILEHFDYPPTLLFFTFLLGSMPYAAAFGIWVAATLAVYLAAVYAILPHRVAVVAALTPFPLFFNILLGHDGFLTAGLLGFALLFMDRRPWLSGVFIGLLTYKPQLGILFPFALLASRNWRAFLGAAAASILFAVAAALLFGWQTWPAFAAALVERAANLGETPQQAFTFALISVFGFLRTAGVAAGACWAAQITVGVTVGFVVCVLWARPIPYPLKAASLAIGSLLASPHVHGYDACILAIGVVFLVKDGLARGFLPRERGTLVACWAGLFLLTGPIPAIICTVVLFLVVRRAARLPGGIRAPSDPLVQAGAGLR